MMETNYNRKVISYIPELTDTEHCLECSLVLSDGQCSICDSSMMQEIKDKIKRFK